MRTVVRRTAALCDAPYAMATARAWESLTIVYLEASNTIVTVSTRGFLRLGQHRTNGLEKPSAARRRQRRRDRPRTDASQPERLRGIDVTDTGQDTLIEQRDLDHDTPS